MYSVLLGGGEGGISVNYTRAMVTSELFSLGFTELCTRQRMHWITFNKTYMELLVNH